MNWWSGLFDARGFAPHGFCLFWNPDLVTLTLVGNLGVAIATVAIPVQLLLAAFRGGAAEVRLPCWLLILLSLFILLNGLGHLFDVVTLFRPLYWLQGIEVTLTALVSLLTAALLPFDLIRSRQRGRDVGV